eukprot:Pompholyxophrys_punicea_v1_NODE_86_length_3660_cov_55.910402.p2 type:complete len:111 gc:universal NODE_86_length_3660_cov_55.910402:658-990(+)
MSKWKGKESKFTGDGHPHLTKIIRKPEPIGLEIKNALCCETGILLRMEIQEKKEVMARKDFVKEYGAGTAVSLRLTQPWWGTAWQIGGCRQLVRFCHKCRSSEGYISLVV